MARIIILHYQAYNTRYIYNNPTPLEQGYERLVQMWKKKKKFFYLLQ